MIVKARMRMRKVRMIDISDAGWLEVDLVARRMPREAEVDLLKIGSEVEKVADKVKIPI